MLYSWWEGLLKRGGMPRRTDDHVINFTPESGFVIEKLAEAVVKAMREMNMDAQVTLPGRVILEIERDCTEREIIDGYNAYISSQINRSASNKNDKEI